MHSEERPSAGASQAQPEKGGVELSRARLTGRSPHCCRHLGLRRGERHFCASFMERTRPEQRFYTKNANPVLDARPPYMAPYGQVKLD
ncbi:unnamed protein product [Rangifer tarandus platyrhynchus]|uniref:Uncharacterized protein n=1 Tax=Rangifer tarandus platyrhynchus TaxID=3082113 RepID=A0ABN8Y6V1_RANTA|nr:unnamed protein product [Rangifer tarandus platyrhynchus]